MDGLEYPGNDSDWYAVDQAGYVASFTVNQGGAVPSLWLSIAESERLRVEQSMSVLPFTTEAVLTPARSEPKPTVSDLPPVGLLAKKRSHEPGSLRTQLHHQLRGWIDTAKRGFYAYDGLDPNAYYCPYQLIARPHTPILLRDLHPDIQQVIRRVTFPTARFASMDLVDLSTL